jgi:hypothetical protein
MGKGDGWGKEMDGGRLPSRSIRRHVDRHREARAKGGVMDAAG